MPATAIDLAARNFVDIEQRGPGVFYVRLRPPRDEPLTPYERRVLDHLQRCAREGVVPTEALTTGPESESKRWSRAFTSEVVADAHARGLSVDAVGGGIFYALTAALAIPALLIAGAWGIPFAAAAAFAAVTLLGWVRRRQQQWDTQLGLEVASRWHGVRAALAENEVFPQHSPLQVALWDRLLAYGAALGVASGATGPLPFGVEPDTRAWSSYGGRWREVRISYPRLWPPAWGTDPSTAIVVGLAVSVASALALVTVGPLFLYAGAASALTVVPLGAVTMLAVVLVAMSAADLKSAVEVTGPIIRRRAFEGDDDTRYYLAVDDGSSTRISAFRVSRDQFETVEQGDVVTVRTTPRLGHVRWIVPATEAV